MTRVCVIGAGITGCGVTKHLAQMAKSKGVEPMIVCYEKQKTWGGIWNYDWRTGADEFGEPVHGSMYRHLWVNQPKEIMEFSDYTYEGHFGRAIPSFPPRAVIADYLDGKWTKEGIRHLIKFCHVVRWVEYNEESDDFTVIVKDLQKDMELPPQRFTHVVVANGHYSVPNSPTFPGLDAFPGLTLHSHELRDFTTFKNKRILVVGSSYSAEDFAVQCVKFGSQRVVISWRTSHSQVDWPEGVEQRPALRKIEENEATFEDESTSRFDVVVLCTGYLLSFPFMSEGLRLKSENRILSPSSLYKSAVFLDGGNQKVFYLGMTTHNVFFGLEEFGLWAAHFILGKRALPSLTEMKEDAKKWDQIERDCHDKMEKIKAKIALRKEMMEEIGIDPGDLSGVLEIFHAYTKEYNNNPLKYRDVPYSSYNTGNPSPLHHTAFMEEFDDSLERFLL